MIGRFLSGYEKKGLPIPVREYKRRMGVIGPEEPWTFEDLQKSAPDGYVCGYEIRIPQFGHSYGIFLVKEGVWFIIGLII